MNCDPGGFAVPSFDCGLNPPTFPRSPGEVRFTPSGTQLVVTVKSINMIYVFPVNKNDTLGTPTLTQATGPNQPTYFGFAFDQGGHMIVEEPFGGSPTIPHGNAASVSSFGISSNGDLTVISGSAPMDRQQPAGSRSIQLANTLTPLGVPDQWGRITDFARDS
jgi:6-phosphogluconolactonase